MLKKLTVCLVMLAGQSAFGAGAGDVLPVFQIRAIHVWDGVRQSQVSPIDWTMTIQSEIYPGGRYDNRQVTPDISLSLSLVDIVPELFTGLVVDERNAAMFGLDWLGLATALYRELIFGTDKLGVTYTATDARGVAVAGSQHYAVDTRYVRLDRIELATFFWDSWDRTVVGTGFGIDGYIYAALTEIPEPASLVLIAACLFLPIRRRHNS